MNYCVTTRRPCCEVDDRGLSIHSLLNDRNILLAQVRKIDERADYRTDSGE